MTEFRLPFIVSQWLGKFLPKYKSQFWFLSNISEILQSLKISFIPFANDLSAATIKIWWLSFFLFAHFAFFKLSSIADLMNFIRTNWVDQEEKLKDSRKYICRLRFYSEIHFRSSQVNAIYQFYFCFYLSYNQYWNTGYPAVWGVKVVEKIIFSQRNCSKFSFLKYQCKTKIVFVHAQKCELNYPLMIVFRNLSARTYH